MFRRRTRTLGLGFAAACLLGHGVAAAVPSVPTNFVVENVTPGTGFDTPTTVAFLPGGRMLVGEKRGRVYAVKNGVKHSSPMVSLESEVLNESDRGLLSIAVDPDYVSNRYIYLAYTVDPDSNGNDNEIQAFARVTRYQVSAVDTNVVLASSRTILIGTNWRNGIGIGTPSHTVGDLQFGADGSLLISTGDGASFGENDEGGLYPNMFGTNKTDPAEDIGAYRSQMLGSLCGKVLRINPQTGQGYASNPYAEVNLSSIRSRVYAYGLRNPYRFCVRPGTGSSNPADGQPGTIYVGDVGWNNWEELSVTSTAGVNFGWPCYEGAPEQFGYQNSTNPPNYGCDTFGTPENPGTYRAPISWWNHSSTTSGSPPGFRGNASTCGAFYTKTLFPAQYRGQLFFADFGQDWLKVAQVNPSNDLVAVLPFGDGLEGPVCLRTDPVSGDLIYVAIDAGQVRRIRYTGATGNAPPVAEATASPLSGPAPLTVNFSSENSYDPDLDPIQASWIFGDGQGSTQDDPVHVFVAGGTYQVILTVDDGNGGIGRDTLLIVASSSAGFPSTPVLDNFNRANGPIGGSWVDQTNGLVIDANRLAQTCCSATTVWNGGGGVFGPDQEAYITILQTTSTAPEQDLMLKVQGLSYSTGHIEVRYDAAQNRVMVATYTSSSGWTHRGGPYPITFAAGDQLGARTYANGNIEVYRNGTILGTCNAGDWPFVANGGRLGLTIDGAFSSRFDDFGGGNVQFGGGNTAPTAIIESPVGGTFFTNGDVIDMVGNGTDAEQSPASLSYDWSVSIHHNNHVHPSSYVTSGANADFTANNHDDGTGVHYEIFLRVTDSGGLADTTSVEIYPSIDLTPTPVVTTPTSPGTTEAALYRFTIRNSGPMPSPYARWRLRAGNVLMAEGDTLVGALDSAQVVLLLPPILPVGNYSLRVTVDTLGSVVETNETNNALSRPMTVVEGSGTTTVPPPQAPRIALSRPYPNPSKEEVRFALDLIEATVVRFSVHDLQGREVWVADPRRMDPGRSILEWSGKTDKGGIAPSGVYLARVQIAGGQSMFRRLALVR